MNLFFAAAAALTFAVGLIHSLFGEKLIFQRMRPQGGLIPTQGGPVLRGPHVRILWASWHALTAMGWGMGAILGWLALPASASLAQSAVVQAITASMLAGAVLVLVGTRGRHPGWAGLLGVAVLVALGSPASQWFR